jgi:hypothetical protein
MPGAQVAAPVLAGVGAASAAGMGALLAVPLLGVIGQRAFQYVRGGKPGDEPLSFTAGVAPPVAPRAGVTQMHDISKYDWVWGFDAKKEVFEAWNPEAKRDYNNFNPFERNDEGQMCDPNGCFPGQSRGYKPPNRPDVDWASQQETTKLQQELMKLPKASITGKPGNFSRQWQDGLGATEHSW